MTKRFGRSLLLVSLAGCAEAGPPGAESAGELGSVEQPIVYDEDDRRDVFEVEDAALRALARSSIAALFDARLINRPESGAMELASASLRRVYEVCSDENFADQPAPATCSGVLIDRDLLLTAGHCVTSEEECKAYAFVFDYFYRAEDSLETVSASDVYGCRKLVAQSFRESGSDPDFAIVQLDRVPSARSPVELRNGALGLGDPLTVMGFSTGLPLKVDTGARVQRESDSDETFSLNSDTFEGSSGSAIFDADLALAGVLVRGGEDFVQMGGCRRSRVVETSDGEEWNWEQGTPVSAAIDELCESGFPSERLCDQAPRCGDGFCSFDPVDEGCAADCGSGSCSGTDCVKSTHQDAEPGEPAPAAEPRAASDQCSMRVVPPAGGTLHWSALALLALVRGTRRRQRS